MQVKIRCKDGVWQRHRINDENLYKLQAKHGEDGVVVITGSDLGGLA